MTTPVTLVYFTVNGVFVDVESADPAGSSSTLSYENISGFVTFYPRLPKGAVQFIANLTLPVSGSASAALAIAPVDGRIMSGQLCTINSADTVGVQLLASSSLFDINPLIYDVKFTQVTYAAASQQISNFGFTAPYTATTVSITDPTLARIPYGGP